MQIAAHRKNKKEKYKAIRQHIYNLFNTEYLPFMGLDKLCKFEIDVQEAADRKTNKYGAEVNHKDGVHTLHIAWETVVHGSQNSKSLLFHEFTHILDHETLLKDVAFNEKSPLLSLYTEYHATTVEMKAACDFKCETELGIVHPSRAVHVGIKPMSLDAFLSIARDELIAKFEAWKANNYKPDDMLFLLKLSIYFIAKAHFVQKYCPVDIHEIIDTRFLAELFGNEFSEMETLLLFSLGNDDDIASINNKHEAIARNII